MNSVFLSMLPAERDAYFAREAAIYRERQGINPFGAETGAPRSQCDKWPRPKPLPDGLLPVPEFDLKFLPVAVAPWVADITDRMQCPIEFVAVPATVALAATLGRKVGIRPQRRTDWLEVPNLWGMVVGRPGAMKSPAASEAIKPLLKIEARCREEFETESKAFAASAELAKIQKDEALKKARKAVADGRDGRGFLDLDEPAQPCERRLIVHDSSYEKLGEVLAENPNGVLVFRDELVSLLRTLDREDNAAARGFYLSAWNGTGAYSFDRIVRGRKHIEAACVSLLGGTQPGRLAGYVRRATSGGAADDGLIQRFGLMVWPDGSPDWREVDRYPDAEARENAWAVFERFDALSPETIGAEFDQFGGIPFLRFDETAGGVFSEWRGDLETRLRSGEFSPALESHLAKYRKLVPALATINHLADAGAGPVTEAPLLRALAMVEYLEAHARRVYGAGCEAETAAGKAILAKIRKGELAEGFTGRDIHQKGWANLSDREQVRAGLELLVDCDWLADSTEKTGGRPRTKYRINPEALK